MPKLKKIEPGVWLDDQFRACLLLNVSKKSVKYIPMEIENGFEVYESSLESFDERYDFMPRYPLNRGCELFLNFAKNIGATADALELLSEFIPISKREKKEITSLRTGIETKTKIKKSYTKEDTLPKKKVAKKTRAKGKSGKYSSAAKMFEELIMSGKYTDNKIFTLVQDEFGLADNRRSYVKWYRKKFTEKGMKPPEEKK